MIKATVIVTTWNRREVLEGLLAALGKQTLANADFEVLVCDSESTDGTRGAVEAAAKLYGNIHYVSISANNPSAKRNEGIQRARTDTVIFLDDDVIPEPGLVEAHVRAHEGATGVAFCGQVRYPATWVRRSNYFRFRDLRHIGPARRLDPKNIPFWNIVVMNLSFKRSELLFHVGYFSEEFAGCYGGRMKSSDIEWRGPACEFSTSRMRRATTTSGGVRCEDISAKCTYRLAIPGQ